MATPTHKGVYMDRKQFRSAILGEDEVDSLFYEYLYECEKEGRIPSESFFRSLLIEREIQYERGY
jgi:hypothetical protein